jgi:hypothetical protein
VAVKGIREINVNFAMENCCTPKCKNQEMGWSWNNLIMDIINTGC